MKEQTMKLLVELLKNSKRSDRELARVLNSSQPTITRVRHKLEREGLIKSYTIVADWTKLGFEIMAFTFIKMRPEIRAEEISEKIKQYTARFPSAIYVAFGEGFGMTGVVALHRNYRDYMRGLSLFRMDWRDYVEDIKIFVTALGEGEIRELSFTYLAKALLTQYSKEKNQ
jgi:DNA-binding Lrp family transcriptional regulator